MKLLLRLRRLFSNKRSVIQSRSETVQLPGRSVHPYWIVGRGLCMYRREDFTKVPRSKRRSALALKLPVWSPFERTSHYCVWSGGSAMVWFWDSDKVRTESDGRSIGARAQAGARVRVLPETVFHSRKPDGLHLQACREGFELQYWRSEVLADAFWFPDRPDEQSRRWFLDRQGTDAHGTGLSTPAPGGAELSPEPWPISLAPGEWLEANERILVASCLLAMILAAVWHEARFWKVHYLAQAVESELSRVQDTLDPLLDARNELLRLRRTNRALADLLREPSQARLMGLVDRALPGSQAKFREWRYQQSELTVLVEDPDLDPITYVRSLEAVPLFDRVRAEPARGDNRIEITLRVQG